MINRLPAEAQEIKTFAKVDELFQNSQNKQA